MNSFPPPRPTLLLGMLDPSHFSHILGSFCFDLRLQCSLLWLLYLLYLQSALHTDYNVLSVALYQKSCLLVIHSIPFLLFSCQTFASPSFLVPNHSPHLPAAASEC
ncbi:hypothetical protein BDW72DRAFT_185727 [Aspergillus terricola var. indicus]